MQKLKRDSIERFKYRLKLQKRNSKKEKIRYNKLNLDLQICIS